MKNGLKLLNEENKIMTSLQIIEVTGKHHYNTMKLIKTLISKGLIGSSQFYCTSYNDVQGKQRPMYELDKSASILVVARQSPEFTAAIIERWQELENAPQNKPETKIEWIQFALDQQNEILQLTHEVEESKPKVKFYNKVADTESKCKTMGDVAKILYDDILFGKVKLFKFLREVKILDTNNVPYQKYITKGYFKVRVKHTLIGDKPVTLVTDKGLLWLSESVLRVN